MGLRNSTQRRRSFRENPLLRIDDFTRDEERSFQGSEHSKVSEALANAEKESPSCVLLCSCGRPTCWIGSRAFSFEHRWGLPWSAVVFPPLNFRTMRGA